MVVNMVRKPDCACHVWSVMVVNMVRKPDCAGPRSAQLEHGQDRWSGWPLCHGDFDHTVVKHGYPCCLRCFANHAQPAGGYLIWMYACVHTCVFACLCVCVHVCVHMCIHVVMYMFVFALIIKCVYAGVTWCIHYMCGSRSLCVTLFNFIFMILAKHEHMKIKMLRPLILSLTWSFVLY